MTAILVAFETALLGLIVVFVVGLLRSHADILRRLSAVESPQGRGVPLSVVDSGASAFDIAGETLTGDSVKVGLGPGSSTTLLAFLSSGCAACGPLWETLSDDLRVPVNARVVIVAKGPEQESITRLRELAPHGREVLMSTGAWRDYSIPGSPHFVLVDGNSGMIAGRGTAASWEHIASMVEQAVSDSASVERNHGGRREPHSTSDRARRAEEALAASGIAPGHASLYPAGGAPGTGEHG
jgi:hypothetical protein